MKPRTLALATFVALFGATASFGAFANNEVPPDDTTPVSGSTLDPAEAATTPEQIFQDQDSLAAEQAEDETDDDDDSDDDDADDNPDDDDAIDETTDDANAEAQAADTGEADASDATMSETTAATTIPPATLPADADAQARRAQGDVARQDNDKNGTLEAGELSSKSELTVRFDEFDVDDNGSLTADEYQGWLAAHAAPGAEPATAGNDTSTLTTTDSTASAEGDSLDDPEADDKVAADIGGEEGRPSDAGTPDTDDADDDLTGLTAQTADEAEETGSEDIGGEEGRPSDAGTPDTDDPEDGGEEDDGDD